MEDLWKIQLWSVVQDAKYAKSSSNIYFSHNQDSWVSEQVEVMGKDPLAISHSDPLNFCFHPCEY